MKHIALAALVLTTGCSLKDGGIAGLAPINAPPPGISVDAWNQCLSRVQRLLEPHRGMTNRWTHDERECLLHQMMEICTNQFHTRPDLWPTYGVPPIFDEDALQKSMTARSQRVCDDREADEPTGAAGSTDRVDRLVNRIWEKEHEKQKDVPKASGCLPCSLP